MGAARGEKRRAAARRDSWAGSCWHHSRFGREKTQMTRKNSNGLRMSPGYNAAMRNRTERLTRREILRLGSAFGFGLTLTDLLRVHAQPRHAAVPTFGQA